MKMKNNNGKHLAKLAPPPLPSVYKMAAPIQLPVKKSGILGRIFNRWEIELDEDYYAAVARIHEAQHAAIKALNDTMLEATTFGLRFRDIVEDYEYKSTLRKLDIKERRIKMRVILSEAMNGDIEYRIKKARLERNVAETQDGDE